MQSSGTILGDIKAEVRKVIPDASVHLFGSRVTGKHTEESDWDILVLTRNKYPKAMKWEIYDRIFPLSVTNASFINLMLVQEQDWLTNPGYYALRKSIGNNIVQA